MLNQGHSFIAAVDESNKIFRIFSQSDFVRLLLRHVSILGALLTRPISSLGVVTRQTETRSTERLNSGITPIAYVTVNTTTMDCFQTMHTYRLSGLPIIDIGSGHLQAWINPTIIRDILRSHSISVFQDAQCDSLKRENIMNSVDRCRGRFGEEAGPIVCRFEDSLGFVLNLMKSKRYHRCYIVEDNKVMGVVSLTDILRKVWYLFRY